MKAAFTRAYNKEVHLTPYSLQVVKKGRRGGGGGGDSELGGEENVEQETQESEEEGDGLKADAMIKVRRGDRMIGVSWSSSELYSCGLCSSPQQKKAKATKATKPAKEKKEETGKGKGKGKGKAKK